MVRDKSRLPFEALPLKISKNLIQTDVDVNLLPFTVVLSNSMPSVLAFFDNNGRQVPADRRFRLMGKTTFQDI
jgi:hypothetical protein